MVSSAGGKKGYVTKSRQSAYKALRAEGNSKSKSAAIANEGVTKTGRKAMAKKAARTRARSRK